MGSPRAVSAGAQSAIDLNVKLTALAVSDPSPFWNETLQLGQAACQARISLSWARSDVSEYYESLRTGKPHLSASELVLKGNAILLRHDVSALFPQLTALARGLNVAAPPHIIGHIDCDILEVAMDALKEYRAFQREIYNLELILDTRSELDLASEICLGLRTAILKTEKVLRVLKSEKHSPIPDTSSEIADISRCDLSVGSSIVTSDNRSSDNLSTITLATTTTPDKVTLPSKHQTNSLPPLGAPPLLRKGSELPELVSGSIGMAVSPHTVQPIAALLPTPTSQSVSRLPLRNQIPISKCKPLKLTRLDDSRLRLPALSRYGKNATMHSTLVPLVKKETLLIARTRETLLRVQAEETAKKVAMKRALSAQKKRQSLERVERDARIALRTKAQKVLKK